METFSCLHCVGAEIWVRHLDYACTLFIRVTFAQLHNASSLGSISLKGFSFPLIGGAGSASPARRTWSRTESSGNFVINCFHSPFFFLNGFFSDKWYFLSNRGRMTTSHRLQMQGTHTLWLSSERWVRRRLTHFTVTPLFKTKKQTFLVFLFH